MNSYGNPIEIIKYVTKNLLSRTEIFEISLNRGMGETIKIEKWILVEMLSKLAELKNKGYIDLFEGEHKYPIMKSTRFEHCDIWWKYKEKEHWLEVKTLLLNENIPISFIKDMKIIKEDIDKINRLVKPYIFHSLVFVFPIQNDNYKQDLELIYKNKNFVKEDIKSLAINSKKLDLVMYKIEG